MLARELGQNKTTGKRQVTGTRTLYPVWLQIFNCLLSGSCC